MQVGAKGVSAKCCFHSRGVDPYTYLVDVLQRVGEHSTACVAELTPRLWKRFPNRSS